MFQPYIVAVCDTAHLGGGGPILPCEYCFVASDALQYAFMQPTLHLCMQCCAATTLTAILVTATSRPGPVGARARSAAYDACWCRVDVNAVTKHGTQGSSSLQPRRFCAPSTIRVRSLPWTQQTAFALPSRPNSRNTQSRLTSIISSFAREAGPAASPTTTQQVQLCSAWKGSSSKSIR
jgi:hypothetical protein